MKKVYILTLTILLLNVGNSAVKANNVDSLLQIARGDYHDTIKIDAWYKAGKKVLKEDYELGRSYWGKGVELSKLIKSDALEFDGYNLLALFFYHTNKNDSIKKYSELVVQRADLTKSHAQVARAHNYFSLYYFFRNEKDSCLYHSKKACDYAILSSDLFLIREYKLNYAGTAINFKDYAFTIELLSEVLNSEGIEDDNDNFKMANIMLGNVFMQLEEFDKSILYYHKVLKISGSTEFTLLSGVNLNLGHVYQQVDDEWCVSRLDSAYHYYTQALKYTAKLSENDRTNVYYSIFNNRCEAKDLKTAEIYLKKLEDIVTDNHPLYYKLRNVLCKVQLLGGQDRYQEALDLQLKYKTDLLERYPYEYNENMEVFYKRIGMYKEAYEALKYIKNYEDSIKSEKDYEELYQKEAQFEYKLKEQALLAEKEKEELRLKSEIKIRQVSNVALIVVVLLLLVISWVIYRSFKLKKKDNILLTHQKKSIEEKEKLAQSLLKELNHRVKNNLQMVTGLITMQEFKLTEPSAKNALNNTRLRIEALSLLHQHLYATATDMHPRLDDYIVDLSGLILNSSGKESITKLELNIDPIRVKTELGIHIGLMVNELMVNAVKYGVSDNCSDNFIGIDIHEKGNAINITVKDSGNNKSAEGVSSSLFGLKLIKIMIAEYKGELLTDFENGKVKVTLNNIMELIVKDN